MHRTSILQLVLQKCEENLTEMLFTKREEAKLRACLHGVGDPGLVGLVSFVFTLWRTQNKRNLPH